MKYFEDLDPDLSKEVEVEDLKDRLAKHLIEIQKPAGHTNIFLKTILPDSHSLITSL